MNSQTKKVSQDAYHEARAFGHSKEDARQIRDNWKPYKSNNINNDSDEEEMSITITYHNDPCFDENQKYYNSMLDDRDKSYLDYSY
jgi:hypothetical protein